MLNATINRVLQQDCIVCGRPARIVGSFVPNSDKASLINTPHNKTRIAFYAICKSCVSVSGIQDIVERKLFIEFQNQK